MTESTEKQARIQKFMKENELEALLLRRVANFAWATCGAASYVCTATTDGVAALLITPGERFLIVNNIEATRLEAEEKLVDQGWRFETAGWYEAADLLSGLTRGMKLGADGPFPGARDLSAQISRYRTVLSPEECDRFRENGRLAAEAMNIAIHEVSPGQTEYQIAGILAREAESRGLQAIVNLVATDERIFNFRHPLPTARKLDRYAMLVLCGRRQGLIVSVTRLIHFGPIPEEIRRKSEAVARIDATFLHETRPGRTLGDIFRSAQAVYADSGYPDEWKLHHQGGPAGYEPREFLAVPGSADVVSAGQAYAWNPSITGAKSEDTILVTEDGYEVLSEIEGWPMISASIPGSAEPILRPGILEV